MVKVEAIGRLTKSLELLDITNQKDSKVANFSLACRDGKETEFIQCTAWNDVAKTIEQYTTKGSLIYVEGRYKTRTYLDEKTQIKHTRIFINIEKFEFLEPNRKQETLELNDLSQQF